MNRLNIVDDQDLYWVRKGSAGCLGYELNDYVKKLKSNKDQIILGYIEPELPMKPMDMVSFSIYSVYLTDLKDHKYYRQLPRWEETPEIAPIEAVDWAKEKAKFGL